MSSTACSIGDSSSRLGYPSIRLEAAQDCYSLDSITYITAAFLFGIFGFHPIFGFQSFSEFFGWNPQLSKEISKDMTSSFVLEAAVSLLLRMVDGLSFHHVD
jgi:hypothetical protein